MSSVFLNVTPYLRSRPAGLALVSPLIVTRRVSLLANQTLNCVKASMSAMVIAWLVLTANSFSAEVLGKSTLTKGLCPSASSRYISPTKGSMSA